MLAESNSNNEQACIGLQTGEPSTIEEEQPNNRLDSWRGLVKIVASDDNNQHHQLQQSASKIGRNMEVEGKSNVNTIQQQRDKEISMEEFAKCADELCTELENNKRLATLKKLLRRK